MWAGSGALFSHHKKHPTEMAEVEIRQFISHLAVDAKISASTQTVALTRYSFYTVTCSKGIGHTSTTLNGGSLRKSFLSFSLAAKPRPFSLDSREPTI